jgi:hypothetical protein
VIVVGSQALGTYDESQLPTAATMSIEVDILPIADSNDETARLADPKSSKGGISVSRMTPRSRDRLRTGQLERFVGRPHP